MFLYCTSDKIGSSTGGGQVSHYELEALRKLGHVDVLCPAQTSDPFEADNNIQIENLSKYKLAHFYSHSFPKFVKRLKESGVKVTYTVAAHDKELSRQEHLALGLPYNYKHLSDPELFSEYCSGYKCADLVICPSTLAENVMKSFGVEKTFVIQHGHTPFQSKNKPKKFQVGYLGQCGADKGLRYLLEAWALLDYKDSILNIAGSQSILIFPLVRHFGKGNVILHGFVKSAENFYNSNSIYVQPSATEGFGIEILEAMSCGLPIIASNGAGANEVVGESGIVVEKRNPIQIAQAIDILKNNSDARAYMGKRAIEIASGYTWEKIQQRYISLWREIIQ
jgi:glycosyltransferase involved in cell wall biosynthesis